MEQKTLAQRFSRAFFIAAKATFFISLLAILIYAIGNEQQSEARDRAPAVLTEAGSRIALHPTSAADIKARIEAAGSRPVMLLVYTSWCPYCRKEYPLMNEAAAQEKGIDFLAVSIDKDKAALANYLATHPSLHMQPDIIADPYDQMQLIKMLQSYGLHFNGPIPFTAIFHGNKAIGEVGGALEKKDFDAMVADIRTATGAGTEENTQK